jgi:hypothetical protein
MAQRCLWEVPGEEGKRVVLAFSFVFSLKSIGFCNSIGFFNFIRRLGSAKASEASNRSLYPSYCIVVVFNVVWAPFI